MEPTKPSIREVRQEIAHELVSKRILWHEARGEFEKLFIRQVLQECDGNVSRAAQRTGVHRNTLSEKIRQHGIERGVRLRGVYRIRGGLEAY